MSKDIDRAEARGSARIVVIGGGYAGVLAAVRVAGKARKRRIPVEVALVNGSPFFVERIRLHELAAGRTQRRLPIERLVRGLGVTLVIGWARRIDADRRTVEVDVVAAEGASPIRRALAYDALVYAPGSVTCHEALPCGSQRAFSIGDAQASGALRARLSASKRGERVIVVGGGLTAIEAATEIAEAFPGLAVTLAAAGSVGGDLSARGRAYLLRALGELGVKVREGARAVEVQDRGVALAANDDGAVAVLPGEIVVVATGLRPSPLAETSGLATTAGGRLLVDRALRAPVHPEIWGAGDAAAALDDAGAPLRMGCVTALPQAAHVADGILASLAGERTAPFGFAFTGRCISLGRRRALIQRADAHDRPLDDVITGWLGARVKELVCRFTIWALQVERLRPGTYAWPGARRGGAADADVAIGLTAKTVR